LSCSLPFCSGSSLGRSSIGGCCDSVGELPRLHLVGSAFRLTGANTKHHCPMAGIIQPTTPRPVANGSGEAYN
jgi:hypothetical protein